MLLEDENEYLATQEFQKYFFKSVRISQLSKDSYKRDALPHVKFLMVSEYSWRNLGIDLE